QPKRKRGRPRKGEEGKETAKHGKSYKYALGKNPENLTEHQQSCLDEIKAMYPRMFRGYQLKEGLRKVFQCSKETIEKEL
ncbi:transposase, partial [Erysipelatoclostridium ramosum]